MHTLAPLSIVTGVFTKSVVDGIGNATCICINRIAPKYVLLNVRTEIFNQSSVKDRLAISIIEGDERRGKLEPGVCLKLLPGWHCQAARPCQSLWVP